MRIKVCRGVDDAIYSLTWRSHCFLLGCSAEHQLHPHRIDLADEHPVVWMVVVVVVVVKLRAGWQTAASDRSGPVAGRSNNNHHGPPRSNANGSPGLPLSRSPHSKYDKHHRLALCRFQSGPMQRCATRALAGVCGVVRCGWFASSR